MSVTADDPLVEFLGKRINEDEAAARAVKPLGYTADMGGHRLDETFSHARIRFASEDGRSGIEPDEVASQHFGRHDPARALREVSASRELIGQYERLLRIQERHERECAAYAAAVEHERLTGRWPEDAGEPGSRQRAIQRESDYLAPMLSILRGLIAGRAAVWSGHPDYGAAAAKPGQPVIFSSST
jgi:hypothetical protein